MIVARVFVSYATPDRAIADEVARWLQAVGHELFLDHDLRDGISVGEDWEQRLDGELRRVDAVIGVVTSSFLASTWCAAEVATARGGLPADAVARGGRRGAPADAAPAARRLPGRSPASPRPGAPGGAAAG
ncbi:MAG: toll/interleukin-1 receptor domain-containing protein [Pseudonocardiaceae bacterium]